MTDRARGARAVAAVGGIRAVPLHPGRDQERHPDPVRDRLPAGLRGRRSRAPSTTSSSACVLRRPADAVLSAEVRFLAPSGERHQARAATVRLPGAMVGALARPAPPRSGRPCLRRRTRPPLVVGLRLGAQPLPRRRIRGGTPRREPDRRLQRPGPRRRAGPLAALDASGPARRPAGGSCRRSSGPADRVNTFPVLADDADDVVLGAAIVLPDHPQIAPESRGGLFDSTEIEEALLLHVQALSDAERGRDRAPGPGRARDDRPRGRRPRRTTSSRCTAG